MWPKRIFDERYHMHVNADFFLQGWRYRRGFLVNLLIRVKFICLFFWKTTLFTVIAVKVSKAVIFRRHSTMPRLAPYHVFTLFLFSSLTRTSQWTIFQCCVKKTYTLFNRSSFSNRSFFSKCDLLVIIKIHTGCNFLVAVLWDGNSQNSIIL